MQLASGAQAFLPTQFGLSFFVWEGGAYNAHTFNFFLFPQPLLPGLDKRFTCQVWPLPHVMVAACSGFKGYRTCPAVLNCMLPPGGDLPIRHKSVMSAHTLQAGSMDFLASQGFDFNKWVHQGIPFMRITERDRQVPPHGLSAAWLAAVMCIETSSSAHVARRLERVDEPMVVNEIAVTKPDDVLFVSQLVEQVINWLQVCLANRSGGIFLPA